MKGFERKNQLFSLCGLNCGLCPMFLGKHCGGCGNGNQSCGIAKCSLEHGKIEYCYECESYPCEKYRYIDKYDSYTFGHNAGGSSAMYRAKRNSGIPGSSMYASTAFGLERVPYDNYPTLLHQGEQVLTAQQVRQQKNIPSVTVTGNQFVIREEADITKVAKAFVAEMQKAYAIT